MRLAVIDSTNSALDVQFGYDGQEMVYEGLSDNRTRRYVHGPGTDEPLVGYLVTSTGTSRLWYHGDERGSIVSLSNDAGTPGGIGKFDEYGIGGTSRFRYTGQYWLGDRDLLYYRARIYDPRLGRFLQPDPIGYDDGMNLYAYVKGDPVNLMDPTGTMCRQLYLNFGMLDLVTNEIDWISSIPFGALCGLDFDDAQRGNGGVVGDGDGNGDQDSEQVIYVTGKRPVRPLPFILAAAGNAAGAYSGPSFCPGARIGRRNFFNPNGRIVTGKVGTFDSALADLDSIAEANDLDPLGDQGAAQVLLGQSAASWFPFPAGDGWWVTKNYVSGDISTRNRGLTFRINPPQNKVNIDIPAGFMLPDGQTLLLNETCHYKVP